MNPPAQPINTELWVAVGTMGAFFLMLLIPVVQLIFKAGEAKEAMANLKTAIQAIHRRIDENSATAKEVAQDFRDRLETLTNHTNADVIEIREAMVGAGILEHSMNGGRKHR